MGDFYTVVFLVWVVGLLRLSFGIFGLLIVEGCVILAAETFGMVRYSV